MDAHLHTLTSTCGRNNRLRMAILALTYAVLGEDDVDKVKLFLLTSPIHADFDIFAPVVCWNFSAV